MRRVVALLTLLLFCALPGTASAQSAPLPKSEPFHLYLGMWTGHLKKDVRRLSRNDTVGFSYRHIFAATFINSFDRRAYAVGLQRELVRGNKGIFSAALGGRLGAVYGYDERFIKLAKDWPVLPMAQAYGLVEIGHVGAEVSWTYVVLSVTGSIRF